MTEEAKPQEIKREGKVSKLEVVITILLGVATILGATAAYFAALCGGEQSSNYTKSISETSHANTIYLEALNEYSSFELGDLKDDIIYTQWKENVNKGDKEDAQYFFTKLSEGLQKDLTDNPADISEYEKEQGEKLKSIMTRFDESEENHIKADKLMQIGQEANKNGDEFTLCTVLFTVVLFFLGLASLKTKDRTQKAYVIIACIVLLFSIIRLVTIPFPI